MVILSRTFKPIKTYILLSDYAISVTYTLKQYSYTYLEYEPAISTEIECLPANVDSHADSTVPQKQMILLILPSRLQYTSLESMA